MIAFTVTSFTLVWIKILSLVLGKTTGSVTSFTLVWIKMESHTEHPTEKPRHELHARVD